MATTPVSGTIGNNTTYTVPAGKCLIITWSRHTVSGGSNGTTVVGLLSGKVLDAGNHLDTICGQSLFAAGSVSSITLMPTCEFTGWLKDV